eukprot:scaffold54835_cov60-Phaeocystis_antarctica.AAC.1
MENASSIFKPPIFFATRPVVAPKALFIGVLSACHGAGSPSLRPSLRNRGSVSGGFYRPGALVSSGGATEATGRQEKSPGLGFELPAHSTEWSGRQGGPVGRPPGRPWPPFGPARAALRAALRPALFFQGAARGGRAGLAALRAALRPSGRPLRTRDVKPAAVGSTAMASSKA